jgi:hypothetical protein
MLLQEFDRWVVGFFVGEVDLCPFELTELRVAGLVWCLVAEQLVVIGHREPPRVERPVVELAQGKPIGHNISAPSPFWIDVGGLDLRDTIGSCSMVSTDRTAVLVGCTDASTESCVAHPATLLDELLILVGQGGCIDGFGCR